MCRLILILGLVALTGSVVAQPQLPSLSLSDSISSVEPEWVDLDNDGLLDILLLMKASSGKDYIGIIQGDTLAPLQMTRTFPIISYHAYVLVDYDRNNTIDILISGEKNGTPATFIYSNGGNFQFHEISTSIPYFTMGRFADFDDDATSELILTGSDENGGYAEILKELSGGGWETVHDSLHLQASSIEVFDADGDGDNDIFVSGKLNSGDLMSGFLINQGKFYFKLENILSIAGNTSAGDMNSDGFFEVVLMGEDENGLWQTKMYRRTSGVYTTHDLPKVLKNGRPFIADFDHDGIADINYSGSGSAGENVNIIQMNSGVIMPLMESISPVRFGDLKHDGNLEYLIVLRNETNLSLVIANDLSKLKNVGPGTPSNAVALSVFDRVFMYWDKPADDHTPVPSLTYDVFLDGVTNYQAGEFDLLNEKRLTVTRGNNGTKNFKLLKNVDQTDLQFAIQAIDNSFHTGTLCIGGFGSGGGSSAPCTLTVTTEQISACSNEKVVFTAPSNALWFSFKDGFLGISSEHSFSADNTEKGDTVFYYHPAAGENCSSLKAWTIKINNDTSKIEMEEIYACEGATVELSVEPGWQTVNWSSDTNGNLGSNNDIQINLMEPDSITVRMSNFYGCQIVRKTALKVSKPVVNVNADHYKIIMGGEVQLQAVGAQRYSWTPQAGLNQTDIPDPIAAPSSSTQYVVTGYDSLDCMGQAAIMVTVEMSGFIPNLFSPNDDGQNDQLKIYGLHAANQFSFSVYDREGSLVYRTSEVTEAVQRGWDGTKNGNKQPPGVYFWKVQGEVGPDRLLLNGKDSGSIVLIR